MIIVQQITDIPTYTWVQIGALVIVVLAIMCAAAKAPDFDQKHQQWGWKERSEMIELAVRQTTIGWGEATYADVAAALENPREIDRHTLLFYWIRHVRNRFRQLSGWGDHD